MQAPAGSENAERQPVLTENGHAAVKRLLAARREGLNELLEDWSPTEHAELSALMARLSAEMVQDDQAFPPVAEQPGAGREVATPG